MLTPQSFSFRLSIVLAVVVTMTLALGLAACDSGGSNRDDDDPNGDDGIAQTYTVTVESIDDSYAYSDQNGIGVAYAIDGEVGRTLTLERGKTYEFELESSVESGPEGFPHPFYVDRTAEGQGNDEFSEGVENAEATSGTVTFTPPTDAPDVLYYVCGNHVYMGGDIELTSSSSSSDDSGGDY